MSCNSQVEKENRKKQMPYVILLMPDQWRGFDLGCMGNSDVKTSCIDQLASEGILLKNTFANTPVCCPARATILTGEYAHKNGMVANDLRLKEEKVTMAELFQEEGYKTGFVGKWHLDKGILGTKYLLNTLTDNDAAEVAYEKPSKRTFPSWGYWIEQGAKTLWEQ